MDIGVTELRANLSEWLARAGDGEEVVITERGRPVARLVPAGSPGRLERLTRTGVIGRPAVAERPRAVRSDRQPTRRPVADRVAEQRR